MPTQAEIWVNMAENAFTVHNITDNRRKMLEIQMTLTQEVRALTAHLATGQTDTDHNRFTTYLRNGRSKTKGHGG